MKLHNCFTVRGASGTATALNSLSENFSLLAAAEPKWARFLTLTQSDGARLYAEAELKYINADPMRGGALRAAYRASVLCPQLKRYTRVSLCNGEKAEVSGAAINYTGSGDTVEITAVIFLEVAESGVKFCGGDNPLIRRLLGCGKEFSARIGWGDCNFPNYTCVPSEALIKEKLPANFTADENGFKFTSVSPTYGSELVLYDENDTPLVRGLRPYELNAGLKAGEADEHCAVLFDENYVEAILTAQVGGADMLRMDCHRVYDAIVPLGGEVLSVGVAGNIASEPTGEYIAVYNSSFAEVYKVTGAEPELKFRVPRTNEYVFVCSGGSLVLWNKSGMKIYEPDEYGNYVEYLGSAQCGDERIILREGNIYHALFRNSNMVYRFTFDKITETVLEKTTVTSALFFLGRCGNAIAWGDRTLYVKTSDSDLSADFNLGEIANHRVKRAVLGIGDCFCAVAESGQPLIFDFVHNVIIDAPQIKGANGRLLYGDNGFYVYDHYNGVRRIQTDISAKGITSACLAGDRIWAVRDGKLCCYYCNGNGMTLRLKAGSEGKNYLCAYRERKLKNLGGGASFAVGLN